MLGRKTFGPQDNCERKNQTWYRPQDPMLVLWEKYQTKETKETSKQMLWQINFWNNFIELKITTNSKFDWLTCTRALKVLVNKTYILLHEPP